MPVDRAIQDLVGSDGLVGIVAGARHVERAELVGLELLAAVVGEQDQLGAGPGRPDREPAEATETRDVGGGPENPEARASQGRSALARRAVARRDVSHLVAHDERELGLVLEVLEKAAIHGGVAWNRPRVRLRGALEREVDGKVRAVGHLVELPHDSVEVALRGRIDPERATLLPGQLANAFLPSSSSSSSERSIISDRPVTGFVAQPQARPPSTTAPSPHRRPRRDTPADGSPRNGRILHVSRHPRPLSSGWGSGGSRGGAAGRALPGLL